MEQEMQRYCKLYAFFKATRGNWRNTIYISCDLTKCPYGHEPACTDYLLTANENGQPLVISVADYIRISGEPVEASECRGRLSRQAFECMYGQYINWHISLLQDCPLPVLGMQLGSCCH